MFHCFHGGGFQVGLANIQERSGIRRVGIPVPFEFPLKFFMAGDSNHDKVRPFSATIQIFYIKSTQMETKGAFYRI
jgi:hypothetical protein